MAEEKKKKLTRKRKTPTTTSRARVKQVVIEPIVSAVSIPSEASGQKPTRRESFLSSIGRRKTSIARVRYYPTREKGIQINGKEFRAYFPLAKHQRLIELPFSTVQFSGTGLMQIKVAGGGVSGQVSAVQLGIARVFIQVDQGYRPALKAQKLLTRDARIKERKKYGLKGARRAPQWQKR